MKIVWPQSQSLFNCIYLWLLILLASIGNSKSAFSLLFLFLFFPLFSVNFKKKNLAYFRRIFTGNACCPSPLSLCVFLVLTPNHSVPSMPSRFLHSTYHHLKYILDKLIGFLIIWPFRWNVRGVKQGPFLSPLAKS